MLLPAVARLGHDVDMEFVATVWRWQARRTDTWTFVSLPESLADEVLELAGQVTRGFGSVRVDVTVGATSWRTSIFPGSTTYVLPLKRAVRAAEGIEIGDEVRVQLSLVDVTPA